MTSPRIPRRPLSVLLSAFLLALVPFSGCRSTGGGGDVLVLAADKPPKSLDPRVGNDSVSARLHQIIFNTLVNKNERLEIVPELATYEVSPDAMVFTFKLKPGVTFHDGRPLTSADVKYTFDTLREPNFTSQKKSDFAKVASIETPDPQTVIFKCTEPNAPMLVSFVAVGIIPKDSGATAGKAPIGSGPFKVVDYQEDREVTLEANKTYFGGAPKIDKLRVRFIPDNATQELEVRNGAVHVLVNPNFSSDTMEKLGSTAGVKIWKDKGTNLAYLGVNCDDPILKDVKVRQALANAVDREKIIKTIFRDQARVAYGPLPPEQWAYPPDLPKTAFDPANAKRLLDESGHPDPDGDGPRPRFKLEIKTSSSSLARQVATVLQEQFKQVGIQLEIRSFEFATFLQDAIAGNYQLFYLIEVGGNQYPDYLGLRYDSSRIPTAAKNYSEGGNRSHYRNPEVDTWIKQGYATLDRNEQIRLFGLAQKKIVEEVPQVFMWYMDNVVVASDRLQNVTIDLSGSYYFLKDATFKQK